MKKLNNKGFSLVELIIVIAIMAILVGVMAPSLMRYIEKSRYSADVQIIDNAYSALKYAMADEAAYAIAVGKSGTEDFDDLLDGGDDFEEEVASTFGATSYTFKSKAFAGEKIQVAYNGSDISVSVTSQDSDFESVTLPKTSASGASGT